MILTIPALGKDQLLISIRNKENIKVLRKIYVCAAVVYTFPMRNLHVVESISLFVIVGILHIGIGIR